MVAVATLMPQSSRKIFHHCSLWKSQVTSYRFYPAIDDTVLLIATLLYLLISCFSLGAAFGLKLAPLVKWSYFAGVTFILFSDTIIALLEYTSYEGMNFLILPTYYAAHISITFALMRRAD